MLALKHLSVAELIAAAGGDPWQVNNTIQSGSPGEISELATAFYKAGVSMSDTSDEFNQAKKRFDAAWDRDDPAHPINDSAEVRRATESLRLDREEITRVGVDLLNIAASLAETQRSGQATIRALEGTLQRIDDTIEAELQKAIAAGEYLDWSELKRAAIDATKQALQDVKSVRDAYGTQLDSSLTQMAGEGYDAEAIEGADGEGGLTPAEQRRADTEKYDANHRAADEALVNSPGPWTPDKQAAAGRLRDFATINDPNASPDAVRHAGERLNDFHMTRFIGPLPVDPILGTTAGQRAAFRQEWQQKLEQGLNGMPPMSPDAATEMLTNSEVFGRQIAIRGAIDALQREGMSAAGAQSVVEDLARGVPWRELVDANAQILSGSSEGLLSLYNSASDGLHYKPDVLTLKDAGIFADVGKRLGAAGTIVDLATVGYDLSQGAPPGERIGQFVGGTALGAAGAWGATVLAGSAFGPGGTFVAAVIASVALAQGGQAVGGYVGSQFDK
jgi:hypothetical protein